MHVLRERDQSERQEAGVRAKGGDMEKERLITRRWEQKLEMCGTDKGVWVYG